MQRRSLLLGLGGILAASVAPAIVTQPMKIVVPQDKILLVRPLSFDYGASKDSSVYLRFDEIDTWMLSDLAQSEFRQEHRMSKTGHVIRNLGLRA